MQGQLKVGGQLMQSMAQTPTLIQTPDLWALWNGVLRLQP
jgi:hypothetical protein